MDTVANAGDVALVAASAGPAHLIYVTGIRYALMDGCKRVKSSAGIVRRSREGDTMKNLAPRAALLACAAVYVFGGFVRVAGAQESTPSPRPTPTVRPTPTLSPRPAQTPPPCGVPNIGATVLRPATPVTPPFAEQQDIEGAVQVVVSLDADSRVVGARIQRTPSAELNQAAITAARQTTFRTEIRDCRPIATDYLYSVDFVNKVTISTATSGERTVVVTAGGTVMRAADVAYVEARFVSRDDDAATATAKHDAAVTALKVKLAPLGIDGSKIRITPAGQVEITVDKAASAGHAAAAAAALTSVEVIGIRFALKDRDSQYREAWRIALANAEKRAREVATSQNLQLGVLKKISLSQSERLRPPSAIIPYRLVPIVNGFREPDIRIPTEEVHASATATYAIKP